jgi:photosystem II stability/assembly factor-like uncharacterized protein
MAIKNLFNGFLITILFSSLLTSNLILSQTWVQQTSGTAANLTDIHFLNTNTGYACGTGGVIVKTTNSGVNWNTLTTGITANLIKIKFFDANNGSAGGDKVIKTTNGGATWIVAYDTAYANDIHFLNQNEWWICSSSPHLNIKTTNAGLTWSAIGASDLIQTSIFFLNQNMGWISGKFVTGSFQPISVYRSTNGGNQWSSQYSQISQLNNGWVYDILFLDPNKGFALVWDFSLTKIITTTNGGANWISNPTPNKKQRNVFFFDGNTGWTCGDNGVIYKSMNGGINWVTETIPGNYLLNSICFPANETGWTCGDGGVILKTTNGGITGVQQTGTGIPKKFSLSQNYPNPFNPVTQINFDLPKTGLVNITIYNSLGKEIKQIVSKELFAGSYSIDWDASLNPSGIYFYKITAGEFTQTRKMVLVR